MNKQLSIYTAMIAGFSIITMSFISTSLPVQAEEQALDTIVVTATRNEIPLERVGSSLTVITEKEIQQRGYTSVAEILRTTVGVTTTNAGGTGSATAVRIRGEEGFRTKILIDGIDAADAAGTQIYTLAEHISLAEIERIEILRGPQGMMYGADAGGVVNIITKRAKEKFAANASTEYGRYNTFNNSGNVRGKTGVFDYSVSASGQSTAGFNALTSDTTLKDDDGYDNRSLNGRFGVDITDNIRTQLALRNVDASHEYDNCGFPATNDCSDDYLQNLAKLDLNYTNEKLDQTISYATTTTDHDFFTNNIKSYYNKGKTTQAQYIGNFFITKTSTALFGIDQKEERITDDGAGAEFERDDTGVYTEWQSSIGSHFFYTAGVRNDNNDDFGSHTTYRTTLAWLQPVSDNTIKYKASYGTGFRAPSLSEIAYNNSPWAFPPASLITLKEETSKGFDAGIEFHAASGLFLEAVYFDQEIQDAIDFDLAGFSGYIQESGKTDSRGIELSADVPVMQILSLFGNYTYNDTETDSGDQRIRRPRHYGNIGVRTTLNKVNVLASMRFANDAEDTGGIKLDDYQVYDASANYTVTENIEIFVRGENIFNNDYEEATGYNTAQAAFFTGIRAKF